MENRIHLAPNVQQGIKRIERNHSPNKIAHLLVHFWGETSSTNSTNFAIVKAVLVQLFLTPIFWFGNRNSQVVRCPFWAFSPSEGYGTIIEVCGSSFPHLVHSKLVQLLDGRLQRSEIPKNWQRWKSFGNWNTNMEINSEATFSYNRYHGHKSWSWSLRNIYRTTVGMQTNQARKSVHIILVSWIEAASPLRKNQIPRRTQKTKETKIPLWGQSFFNDRSQSRPSHSVALSHAGVQCCKSDSEDSDKIDVRVSSASDIRKIMENLDAKEKSMSRAQAIVSNLEATEDQRVLIQIRKIMKRRNYSSLFQSDCCGN